MTAYEPPALFYVRQARHELARADLIPTMAMNRADRYLLEAVAALAGDASPIRLPVSWTFWLGAAGEVSPSAIGRWEPPGDGEEVL